MTEENNLNFPRLALAFIDQKTRDHSRTGIGGKGSGESQVRGLMDRRKIRGGPPPLGTDSLGLLWAWTEICDWRREH